MSFEKNEWKIIWIKRAFNINIFDLVRLTQHKFKLKAKNTKTNETFTHCFYSEFDYDNIVEYRAQCELEKKLREAK